MNRVITTFVPFFIPGFVVAVLGNGPVRAEAVDQGIGMVHLKEAVGPRSSGMGGISVGLTGHQVASSDNPGAVATLKGRDVLFAHSELFAGIRQEYLGLAFGTGRRGVGLAFGVRTAGGIERRVGPSIQPLGTFNIYDLDLSVGYAQRTAGVNIGFRFRLLHHVLEAEGASGAAIDLGILAKSPFPGLILGATLRNLGTMDGIGKSSIRLPLSLRTGLVYQTRLTSIRNNLLIASEIDFPRGGDVIFRSGIEYVWNELLALRGGYQAGRDALGASFGFGLGRGGIRLDYSTTPYRFGLGNAHRISLGLR